MGVQKTKLTEWPEDLKDVIDWFLRVGGKDPESKGNDKKSELKDAVYQLEGKDVLENALGNGNLEGLFGSVAKGLQSFIGYDTNGTHEFTENGIAAKSGYTSSYSKEAQWSGNLNTPHSEEAKKAAKLFLCYMPLLYICLIYMYWKCKLQYGGWGSYSLHRTNEALGLFMVNMGFKPSTELQDIKGSNVAESLTREPDGFSELKKAPKDEYYFSSYLGKVSEYGESEISKPASCPLYALYKASTEYLMSRYIGEKDSDETLENIKQKLQGFRASFHSDQDLKGEIGNFISTCIPSFTPVNFTFDCPSNLKEAIDWILRITGRDVPGSNSSNASPNIQALARAFKGLWDEVENRESPAMQGVLTVIGHDCDNGRGPISLLADGLGSFIGYTGGQMGSKGIGSYREDNGKRRYRSAYSASRSPGAAWDVDLSKEEKQTCAIIFTSCVPIYYYVLTYLSWRCRDGYGNGEWSAYHFDGVSGGRTDLEDFMKSMGFESVSLSHNTGKTVMDAVAKKISDLDTTRNGRSYSELLKQMEVNGTNLKSSAVNYPLYGLYFAALSYFKSHVQNGKEITDGFQQIKSALESLPIQSTSSQKSYGALKKHIEDLLSKVKSFRPSKRVNNKPEEQVGGNRAEHADHESPILNGSKGVNGDSTVTIGSAAGGVALLGGGGAALYFLNVGGIKTLITGVP
ncbi:variant erythrocyte surface antigen-1 family protein [Babesia caballi]|uniref:Variant erythrocyte surface antigen-1 family protein n=1 Tax=Babesia caballi TaxID=5871 RepID=A0AAV4LMU0_BABCB|nr:variant erythrocyte surface antigen-1 family protein [Babesia caballi]